jgi:hypothetical protein
VTATGNKQDRTDRPTARSAPEEALRAARAEVLPRIDYSRRDVPWSSVLEAGWTPAGYRWLKTLAQHAQMVRAEVALLMSSRSLPNADEQLVIERLLGLAEDAAVQGGSFRDVGPWLAVIACETNKERSRSLLEALAHWGQPMQVADALTAHATGERPPGPWMWSDEFGPAAPLAYIARISLAEARVQHAAGTLTEQSLRMLLTLRGYILPPPFDESAA